MKFLFLGYSVKKIMDFNLDVKDIIILRYFEDFKESGKMNYEEVKGEKYYWVSYQGIEKELPFLNLTRKSIMARMHKLRDGGFLKHYTKKEGGTFSYYALDKKYYDLLYSREDKGKKQSEKIEDYEEKQEVKDDNERDKDNYLEKNFDEDLDKDLEKNNENNDEKIDGDKRTLEESNYSESEKNEKVKNYKNHEEGFKKKEEEIQEEEKDEEEEIFNYKSINFHTNPREALRKGLSFENDRDPRILEGEAEIIDREDGIWYRGIQNKEERVDENMYRGCPSKGRTKIHLLNNPSTKVSNLIKDIEKEIIDYLNLRVGVIYKSSNFKTLTLIRERLKEGFTLDDFKRVIDKKFMEWKSTSFEKYLTPLTLFGDKFEIYLNQKIIREDRFAKSKNFENEPRKLRFNNFEPREYDYDSLERKLLGWE